MQVDLASYNTSVHASYESQNKKKTEIRYFDRGL